MLARGRLIGWALIGAIGVLPVAGAVALRVAPQSQAAQAAVQSQLDAAQAEYLRGALEERDKLNQWRAINGTSGVGYGPLPDPKLYEGNPYLQGAYAELAAEAKGETVGVAGRQQP